MFSSFLVSNIGRCISGMTFSGSLGAFFCFDVNSSWRDLDDDDDDDDGLGRRRRDVDELGVIDDDDGLCRRRRDVD